jgi:putative protease
MPPVTFWPRKAAAERQAAKAEVYVIEEGQRPGSYMPIEEDEHGTYVMNSKDLRAIEHVQRLVEIGVDSLKIEGRTKSPYYVARTVQTYAQAIRDAVAGRELDPALLGQLEGLANRGYTSGFFQRHTPEATQNYLRGYSESGRSLYVGDVLAFDEARGLAQVNVRNRFAVGDLLEIIHPSGNNDVRLTRMENAEAQAMTVAPGSGHTVWLPLPASAVGAFVARYVAESELRDALCPRGFLSACPATWSWLKLPRSCWKSTRPRSRSRPSVRKARAGKTSTRSPARFTCALTSWPLHCPTM